MVLTDALEEDEFPPAMAVRVQSELEPGERLVWMGRAHLRPRLGRRLVGAYLGCLLPVLALLGFGIASLSGFVFRPPAQGMDSLVGGECTFVGAVGLVLVVAITIYQFVLHSRSRRTCYALTDRRAVVWRPAPGAEGLEVRSFRPAEFNTLFRIDHGDGSGDLIFHEITVAAGVKPQPVRQGFLGIRQVRQVEALVRKTLLEPPPGPSSQGVFAP